MKSQKNCVKQTYQLAISGLVFYLVHIMQQAQARDTAVLDDAMTDLDVVVHQKGETSDAVTVASVEALVPVFIESIPSQSIETTVVVDEEGSSEEVMTGVDTTGWHIGDPSTLLLLGSVALIGGGVAVLANDGDSKSNNVLEEPNTNNTSNGSISDDDSNSNDDTSVSLPTISISDVTTSEDVGSVAIPVTLSEASNAIVTVDYATSDDTATSGDDYYENSGTLTFDSGVTETSFFIEIIDDDTIEGFLGGDETFNINLSNPSNGILSDDSSATLTITDDDSFFS